MKILRYSAKITLVLCSVALAQRPQHRPPPRARAAPSTLAELVRTYRRNPTPASRAPVVAYAASHPKEAALANLAIGVTAYEQADYPAAIAALQKARLPQAPDYPAYYLAAARVENNDLQGVADGLAAIHAADPPSPLSGKAWLLAARALKDSQPLEAVRILREHYADLPQPQGDLALAGASQSAGDLARAADFYQRVYYQRPTAAEAELAAAAIVALKEAMGASYPAPLPQQILRRADRLFELRDYARARSDYQDAIDQSVGLQHDQARVRLGAADLLGGNAAAACAYLRDLDLVESEADAERLYYLEECGRRGNEEDSMISAVNRLAVQYPHSAWRARAVWAAASKFLLANRSADFVPLYRAVYQDFPNDPNAPLGHWRVTFQAYLHDQPDSAALLRDHLESYPSHFTAAAALYFLGRRNEASGDFAAARACYQRLADVFQNYYYALLARDRLRAPEIAAASPSPEAAAWAAGLKLPAPNPLPAEPTLPTLRRIERSRALRAAGLDNLADAELRFGARTGGQPPLLGLEMASASEAPNLALRIMKSMAGDYLGLSIPAAPRKFWELLFPLPYRADLVKSARANGLDPNLIAGLIRQESEFNPQAVSPANAYGLTQVRPVTGREYARRAGIQRFNSRMLFQPAVNLRIGASIFRGMLDRHEGRVEETLAAYNAGPARAAQWIGWAQWREPAEFVESIPFTETRDYVQAVLRNADIYRRLYP